MGSQSEVPLRGKIWGGSNGKVIIFLKKKNINIQHAELGFPLDQATGWEMGFHITGTFKSCEDCALGKLKRWS